MSRKFEVTAEEMVELNKLRVIRGYLRRNLDDITDSEIAELDNPAIRDLIQTVQFWVIDTYRNPTR